MVIFGFLLVSIICIAITQYKYKAICMQLYEQNDLYLYYRNKISMIEYQYRNHKEGCNIYTSMRNIGEILYKDFYDK